MAHRPNILALASKISLESLTYTGITYGDPEYRILDPIVDDDMCSVMMRMRLETDFSAEDLAKKTRKSLDFVQTQCDKLVKAGVIRTRVRSGVLCYYYPIWVPGIMEGILSNREQCDAHPELGACFEEYTRIRVGMLAPMLGNGVNFMRVMPVMSAIENDTHKASYDEISTLIEKAWAISVGPCSCRRSRRLMGEGCGHLEEDMCLYLNDNAISFSKNGEHRLITKEEAYEILRRAEDNGLVHEVNQALGFDDVTAICNCCGCSCYALRIAELFRSPNGVSSNFIARVDKDKCVACGQCVENCQTNAVRLGQKHCLTDSHISDAYASDKEIPWDKKSYNIDYRTTRTDIMPSGTAPCKAECPAHVPVQGYIKLAAQGRYTEALELIKKENPFPAVCGRICNKACEDACTRGSVDAPIAIDDIKKFIAGKDLEAEHRFVPKMVNQTGKPYEEKIAVIGSGPAGLTCAYYLALKGYPVTVFEKEKELGGMLTLGIPSFRLEKDVVQAEIDILREMGVEFRCGVDVGRNITIPELRAQGYKGFYVAVGLQDGGRLRVPGDDAEGVMSGVDFTKKVNLAPETKLTGKVVVIGGGNIASDVARTAVRCGAESVTLYCLEGYDEMPMGEEDRTECERDGISIHAGWGQTAIDTENGHARAIRFRKCLSVKNAEGRFAPAFDDARTETAEADTILYCIGQHAAWGELLAGTKVEFNPNGTVKADPLTYQTAEPDIFVGGDAYTGQKFAIDAIAAGKEGAVSLHRFVQPNTSLTIGRNRRQFIELDKKNVLLDINSFDNTPRQRPGYNEELRRTMQDGRACFTEEQVKTETARCLGCGASVVDPNKCIGCGICTTRCGFDAIRLHRERPECSTMVRSEDKMKAILPYMLKRAVKIKLKGKKG